jgi:hypothetical protein
VIDGTSNKVLPAIVVAVAVVVGAGHHGLALTQSSRRPVYGVPSTTSLVLNLNPPRLQSGLAEEEKHMFRSRKCWTCLILMVIITFASLPARATTRLHVLVKADLAENAAAVAEKIPSLPMTNCKPSRPVPFLFEEIIFVLECPNPNYASDVSMLSRLEHLKSVLLFAVDNQ